MKLTQGVQNPSQKKKETTYLRSRIPFFFCIIPIKRNGFFYSHRKTIRKQPLNECGFGFFFNSFPTQEKRRRLRLEKKYFPYTYGSNPHTQKNQVTIIFKCQL